MAKEREKRCAES